MMSWLFKGFDQLSTHELYQLLALRSAVFVVEQACVYLDPDGKDMDAIHLLGYRDQVLNASLRIYIDQNRCHIGRVVIAQSERGNGLGYTLLQKAIDYIQTEKIATVVHCESQQHLERFYQNLGFETQSAPYDLDGIMHVDMIKTLD